MYIFNRRAKLVSNVIELLFSTPEEKCPYKSECRKYKINQYEDDARKNIFLKECVDVLDAMKRWDKCGAYPMLFIENITHGNNRRLLVEYSIKTVLSLEQQGCINDDCPNYGKVEYEKNGKKGNLCTGSLSVKERWFCKPYRNFLSKQIEKGEKGFRRKTKQKHFRSIKSYFGNIIGS
jgi:hypothetical protein